MNYTNQNLFYRNFAFCLPFFIPLLLLPKGSIEQRINLFEFPSLFPFFKWITLLGDGWIMLIVLTLLWTRYLMRKRRKIQEELLHFLFSALFMIVVVTLMKTLFFYAAPRPVEFFGIESGSSLLERFDIRFHHFRSFPSGHTATVAVVGFYFMRYCKHEFFRRLLFAVILLGGFSRIFLFQHFVADVIVGISIGLISIFVGKYTAYRIIYGKTKKRVAIFPNMLHASE
jgi:membrane-associated phospholipid phosphatase